MSDSVSIRPAAAVEITIGTVKCACGKSLQFSVGDGRIADIDIEVESHECIPYEE